MGFVLRRLSFYLVALFIAISFNFLLPRLMPGSPVDALFAGAAGKMTPESLAAYTEMLGFVEGPLWSQYLIYLKSVLTWDLGPTIMMYPIPVTEVLNAKLPWTVFIAGSAVILAIIVGVLIGTYASYNRGKFVDSVMPAFWSFVGAFPYVVTALLLFYFFSMQLQWFPLSYGADPDLDVGFTWVYFKSILYHACLPLTAMVLSMIGGWIFNMRNAMINVLGEDYITMAKAKGLSAKRIMTHYAARNAILPVVTAISMQLGFVMAGAIFVEIVFNYPGLGSLMLQALKTRDYPLMQALLLMIVVCVLAANFIADLLYLWLDPRLRK